MAIDFKKLVRKIPPIYRAASALYVYLKRHSQLCQVPIDICTNPMAFSFAPTGWNYLIEQLKEFDSEKRHNVQNSALWKFHEQYQPKDMSDLPIAAGLDVAFKPGLSIYPWGSFDVEKSKHGGTAKNAYKLHQKGLNVISLPKTIDNDIFGTDVSFGFDTALHIAVEAIDRLHSTAHSHHRIIVVEIMGHRAGWLALGAGVAGGADAILIPEIPYDVNVVAESILSRSRRGKRFSIVAVAEGAVSKEFAKKRSAIENELDKEKDKSKRNDLKGRLRELEAQHTGNTLLLSEELEQLTGLESRLTILGHLQRGGTPSAADRLLATCLGTACVDSIREGVFGAMIASRGDRAEPVPLEKVVNKIKYVPTDHPWVLSARGLGTSFGD